ncbi:hypothetical protein [Terasakiella sp.]
MIKIRLLFSMFCVCLFASTSAEADALEQFNKNRIKQMSKHSDRYNYYEKKNGVVKRGSKNTGLDARKVKGFGKVHNWVEINNSKLGGVTRSIGKRFKAANPMARNKGGPDRNLGVISGCKKVRSVSNTVKIKNSKIENGLIGADVNSGVSMKGCSRGVSLTGKSIKNSVTISKSRVGGAAGLLKK